MRTPRILVAATLLTSAILPAQTNFCTQIKALVQDSPAHWGISIATLDGAPLCALNDAQLFRPASNAKLFTTAAALAILGPDHTFETKVTGKLDPATGIVHGDLTLVGGGDANLDSGDLPYQPGQPTPAKPFAFHDLEDLAAQLVAKGVKAITGDIVGDDTLFPYEPYQPSWELGDLVWGYGAPVSALTIVDNQLKLTITPGNALGSRNVNAPNMLNQNGVPYYTVNSDVAAVSQASQQSIEVRRSPGSRTLYLVGTILLNAPPDLEEVSIDDPALYAAVAFRQVLAAHGIKAMGKERAAHDTLNIGGPNFLSRLKEPLDFESAWLNRGAVSFSCLGNDAEPTLAKIYSAPIAQDIVFTDKTSQDLHAELLLHAIGGVAPCWHGSTVAGARMVRAFLIRAGIGPDDFLFYDGSGLSSHDLVTPRATTQLLAYAAKQPWFANFKAALPIGGVDGSLTNRFTGQDEPQLSGKVFAKTGTLGESRALSGYLTAFSGQTLIFSILADNHPPGTTTDRALTDQIVALTAAAN
jgi:D-alanyl-D-alanine carboxypeptidase/D-alanyl-D-alanine-endopeptidase (penicillin-binding protein 4)